MKTLKVLDKNEDIANYSFIEHVEYFDQKLNFKKTTSRVIQNDENLLDILKAWNRLKLESKIQDVETNLILKKKVPQQQQQQQQTEVCIVIIKIKKK